MAKLILAAAGLLALVLAAFAGWIGWTSRSAAARLRHLPELDSDSMVTLPPGSEGIAVGTLSARNPALYRDLVLYFHSRFDGWRKVRDSGPTGGQRREPVWRSVSKALPPLLVETAEETLRVAGAYSVTFQGSDPSYLTTETLEAGVSERYEGLRAGATVTVVGAVAEDDEGRYLAAASLISGDRERARAGEDSAARFGLIAAAVLGLAALILLGLAIGG